MNENRDPLETVLRAAPTPKPPVKLESALVALIVLDPKSKSSTPPASLQREGFWQRWWPVLFPGAAVVALAAVVAVQQVELNEAPVSVGKEGSATAVAGSTFGTGSSAGTTGSFATSAEDPRAELARLRAQVKELTDSLAGIDSLAKENARLATEIAALKNTAPPELQELEEAQARGLRIHCVNNMKRLGLAVRIYAVDNHDSFPTDLRSIIGALGEEQDALKTMICPADESHQPAADAASFTPANCSYEFLAPGPGSIDRAEPNRVMFRCTVHNNVTLCDGSVQQLSPERMSQLVQRDGKLFLGEAP